jgi:hypothetical protein
MEVMVVKGSCSYVMLLDREHVCLLQSPLPTPAKKQFVCRTGGDWGVRPCFSRPRQLSGLAGADWVGFAQDRLTVTATWSSRTIQVNAS